MERRGIDMAKIVKVRKATWTQRDYKRRFQYYVFYDSGMKVHYSDKQCLPITVVNFLMRDDIECETEYKGDSSRWVISPIKWERFTIKSDEDK